MENHLSKLHAIRSGLPYPADRDTAVREQMLREARGLILDLETPKEVIIRIGFQVRLTSQRLKKYLQTKVCE